MDPNFRYSSRYMPPQTPTTPFINSSPYPHPLHNPSLSLAHTHVHSLPHAMTHPQPHLHPHPHPQIHSHPPSHSHSHPYHFPRPFIPSNNPHLAESQLNMKMSDLVLHEDKPMKGEPKACLFVASLNAQRTDEQLTESVTKHFCKWGKLMNVKVMKDWMHRPYAFVQYNSVEDARRALEESHDTIIDGRHIRVEQAKVNRTLFLAKLPKSMTDETLKKYLEKWGQIEGVTLLYNHATGKSKGCGFAKFRYREDAIRAYLHIRQQNKWSVEWAANIEKQQPERDLHSVFIGQLNAQLVTQEFLENRFSQYGPIESLHLVNKNGEAFAFLRFEEEESAQLAIEMENGSSFLDRWIKVQYRETPEARTPKKVPPPLPLQLPTPGMNRVAREEVEHTEHLRYPMTFQQTSCNRGFPLPTTTDLSPVSPTDFTLESGRYFRSGFRPTTFAHTSAPASPSPPSSPLHLTFPLHCRASSSPHIRMPMNFPTTSMHFPSYFTSATGHLDSSTPAISSSSSNSNTATTTTTTSTSTSTSTTTPSQSQSPSPTPSPSSSSSMSSNTSFHTRQHSSGSIVGINLSSQPPTASTYVGGPPSRYPNFEMNLYNVPDVDDKSKSGSVPEAYE